MFSHIPLSDRRDSFPLSRKAYIRDAETPDTGRFTLVLVNIPVATNMRRNDGDQS